MTPSSQGDLITFDTGFGCANSTAYSGATAMV